MGVGNDSGVFHIFSSGDWSLFTGLSTKQPVGPRREAKNYHSLTLMRAKHQGKSQLPLLCTTPSLPLSSTKAEAWQLISSTAQGLLSQWPDLTCLRMGEVVSERQPY
uniref:Uncharacterized protein n=1 Tax=Cynoglossus semilaevis TaxID=244447 RepID=A0A3P8WU51_CYNSE